MSRAYWEIIADEISAAGWSWRYCAFVEAGKETLRHCVDAHKNDGVRYIVHSDDKLQAFHLLRNALPKTEYGGRN